MWVRAATTVPQADALIQPFTHAQHMHNQAPNKVLRIPTLHSPPTSLQLQSSRVSTLLLLSGGVSLATSLTHCNITTATLQTNLHNRTSFEQWHFYQGVSSYTTASSSLLYAPVSTAAVYEGVSKSFWTDHNEIYVYNNKHLLRSNTKGYGSKTHYTDS